MSQLSGDFTTWILVNFILCLWFSCINVIFSSIWIINLIFSSIFQSCFFSLHLNNLFILIQSHIAAIDSFHVALAWLETVFPVSWKSWLLSSFLCMFYVWGRKTYLIALLSFFCQCGSFGKRNVLFRVISW